MTERVDWFAVCPLEDPWLGMAWRALIPDVDMPDRFRPLIRSALLAAHQVTVWSHISRILGQNRRLVSLLEHLAVARSRSAMNKLMLVAAPL